MPKESSLINHTRPSHNLGPGSVATPGALSLLLLAENEDDMESKHDHLRPFPLVTTSGRIPWATANTNGICLTIHG